MTEPTPLNPTPALAPTTPLPIPLSQSGSVPAPKLIVIMGGTFDPPHIGHAQLPAKVREELETRLDLAHSAWLLFVPAARSPHKAAGPVASDADRVHMLSLATSAIPRSAVWTDEIDRARTATAPSFTVDTLFRARAWLDHHGLSGCGVRLLIGADQAVAFHTWRDPRDILRLATPAVMVRGDLSSAASLVRKIEDTGYWKPKELDMWRNAIVPVGLIDVSATQVRTALARGDEGTLSKLLHPDVANFIRQRGLYLLP
jgi:nicotinate-nucleotide adenylyltransferase